MNNKTTTAILLFALAGAAHAQQMPHIEMTLGFHRIEAEVAALPETRQLGLMHRRSMAQHQGMLFVFPERMPHCMWMRNTFIPLSVAFLDDEGRILNIEDMQPQTEDNHCAVKPARYALEMNKGWFAARGIRAGTRLSGIDKAPAPR